MTERWSCCCQQWGLGVVGAIATASGAFAQSTAPSTIVPDATLGTESSQVIQNFDGLAVEVVAGGAIRGSNLFHSFQEFNVNEGRGAYFFSPNAAIQNILARVTGSNPSQVLGTLGTFGSSQPGLFLINPNGVVFGQYSSLDVGGSFVATTANAVLLGDTGRFSASEPASSVLLSVNPSALFFNAVNAQATIVNRSTATATVLGIAVNGDQNRAIAGLQVLDGQSLLLVGGNVSLDNGILRAPGGRVEIGGVAAPGTIGLTPTANQLGLDFSAEVARADVSIINSSNIGVAAGGNGTVVIHGGDIDLSRSSIIAGIAQGLGSPESRAGDITVNATGIVTISDSSVIGNGVLGVGDGGNTNLLGKAINITNGSIISAASFGQGKAGTVTIQAADSISLLGRNESGSPSGILSTIASLLEFVGVGLGGNIYLQAQNVLLRDGALVSSSNVFAQGKAGTIRIDASDSLFLFDGAQLGAGTVGRGDAGDIVVIANQVAFDGISRTGNSGAFSTVERGGVGKGGNLRITTNTLSLTNGAVLNASTFGQGDAGDVIVDANQVAFDGTSSNGFSSGAFSAVNPDGVGKGGNLRITTNTLSLTNGAVLNASTFGQGDAGDIIVGANQVAFDGTSSDGFSSGAFSVVNPDGVGKGGNVRITATNLSLTNGAQLGASTFGQGDAGDVIVDANQAAFDGTSSNGFSSGAFSTVERDGIGKGGNVRITATNLSLTNGGVLLVSSFGQGDAGNISAVANVIGLDQGNIEARTTAGNGGNIILEARNRLVLRNGSGISTTAGTTQQGGNGGNIIINAPFIIAIPEENSDITANAFTGSGGKITITTQGIFGLQFRPQLTPFSDITASSDFGVTGVVTINSPDNSSLQNSFTEFPQTLIDPNQLLATSCIVRQNQQAGSFVITGSDSLPQRPSDILGSHFPTGTVQSVREAREENPAPKSVNLSKWKPGDPIVEPQGIYRLTNGQLVMSRECDR